MVMECFKWLNNKSVQRIITVLSQNKHNFKFVGGCVRDSIIGIPFDDYDIASNITPQENIKLLNTHGIKTITTGLKNGTVTAIIDSIKFEITSLRIDVNQQGRQTDVIYTQSFMEDSLRRDFTFNALYLDPKTLEVLDFHKGISDLNEKKVRFIGNPAERIKEDYLRIMRYFRFKSLYGNNDFNDTQLKVLTKYKDKLSLLSKERLSLELTKLLSSVNCTKSIEYMYYNGFFDYIFPVNNFTINNLHNLIDILSKYSIQNNINIKLAFLMSINYDARNIIGKKKDYQEINNIKYLIKTILNYQDYNNKNMENNLIYHLTAKYSHQIIFSTLLCILALCKKEKINYYSAIIANINNKKGNVLPINAQDLIAMGIREPEIKKYLRLLEVVFWKYNYKSKEDYTWVIKLIITK